MNIQPAIIVDEKNVSEDLKALAKRLPWVQVGYSGGFFYVVEDTKKILFRTRDNSEGRRYLRTAVAAYEGSVGLLPEHIGSIEKAALKYWLAYERRLGAYKR